MNQAPPAKILVSKGGMGKPAVYKDNPDFIAYQAEQKTKVDELKKLAPYNVSPELEQAMIAVYGPNWGSWTTPTKKARIGVIKEAIQQQGTNPTDITGLTNLVRSMDNPETNLQVKHLRNQYASSERKEKIKDITTPAAIVAGSLVGASFLTPASPTAPAAPEIVGAGTAGAGTAGAGTAGAGTAGAGTAGAGSAAAVKTIPTLWDEAIGAGTKIISQDLADAKGERQAEQYYQQKRDLYNKQAGIGRERVSQDYAREMDNLRRSQHIQNLNTRQALAERGITNPAESSIGGSEWTKLAATQEADTSGRELLKNRALENIGLQLEESNLQTPQYGESTASWGEKIRSNMVPSVVGGGVEAAAKPIFS